MLANNSEGQIRVRKTFESQFQEPVLSTADVSTLQLELSGTSSKLLLQGPSARKELLFLPGNIKEPGVPGSVLCTCR